VSDDAVIVRACHGADGYRPRRGDGNPRLLERIGTVLARNGERAPVTRAFAVLRLGSRQECTYRPSEEEKSRIGAFAVIVLGVAGIMRIFDAIWAFRYHGVLPGNLEDGIFGHSLETYGWIYLIVAAVLIACAFLVLSESQVARWVGIAVGAIGAISAIWWMSYYPIWSLTYIAIGGLAITHWSRMETNLTPCSAIATMGSRWKSLTG
jgi:hypothetical protein